VTYITATHNFLRHTTHEMPAPHGRKITKATQVAQPAAGATLADLPQVLRACMVSDNGVRGAAEATLKVLG